MCQWLKSTWLHCLCYSIQTYYGCLLFHCSGGHEPIEMSETYDVIQRNTQPTQKLLSDTDPAYKKLEKVLCICHTYSAVCDTRCCECVVLSNQCGNFVKCSLSFFTQTFAIRDMDQFPLTKFIKTVHALEAYHSHMCTNHVVNVLLYIPAHTKHLTFSIPHLFPRDFPLVGCPLYI